jgi:hypothetical protein
MIAIMAGRGRLIHHFGMIKLLTALAVLSGAPALAQHHPHAAGGHSHGSSSSYSGEETREIKALSAQEQRAWMEGQGAGLAKAAELNGYPGPMHVLELASDLGLSASQQNETRALMEHHKAEVRQLGAALVEAERQLDDLFKTRRASAASVSALTQKIGNLQMQIRTSHLITHLDQTKMMRPDQVATYDRLRGYSR